MAQPGTPGAASIFGGALNATPLTSNNNNNNNNVQQFMALAPSPDHQNLTPASVASSSNNTYIMPKSPMKNQSVVDRYRPKVTRTVGQKPACLVNASVTYCGNNQIYAFGGFDQYTDEVYNHVLRLDLVSHQWSLVDNYGDIPGVRMGRHLLDFASVPWFETLTEMNRPYCDTLQGRQTSGIRRRERAQDLPVRSHNIRP